MRYTLLLLACLSTFNLIAQDLTEKTGAIEISFISHYFKRNPDMELTKKISNKENRPGLKMYFDAEGFLLKTIGFGKHHNTDLRLLDRIRVFKYNDNLKIEMVEYECDYDDSIYPYWKTRFAYNNKKQLIDESTFYYENDSLFQKTAYEYDENNNLTKTIKKEDYYHKSEFDSLNRLMSFSQIYENKLRWDWKYTYEGNQRIGIFQTYYDDGDNYSKKEIKTYNDLGQLIEIEEKNITKEWTETKTLLFYGKNNFIKRYEYYESSPAEDGYKLISYTDIKIKSKKRLTKEIVYKLNNIIIKK